MIDRLNAARRGLRGGSAVIALAAAGLLGALPALAQDATNSAAPPSTTEPASTSNSGDVSVATGTQNTTSAQDPAAADDTGGAQDVVVTGTLIRNSATATAAPIVELSAQDFVTRGQNTVAEALQTIPSNGAGTISRAWNSFGFSSGATAVSLRGLTVGNTLTLFDGQRSALYPLGDDGQRSFVDLNTIPQSIVERVEVLQDGASATYGADAVAGVVNVIVKKQIVGLHANGSAGISQRGDAGEQRADLTYGYGNLREDGFNIYVNGEYQRSDPLYARDRGYPFNTGDYSRVCKGGNDCLTNETINGVQPDGTIAGLGSTRVPIVRPYDDAGPAGPWRLLNPGAGCRDLNTINLTDAQRADLADPGTEDAPGKNTPIVGPICQQDNVHDYLQEIPSQQRYGANIHATVNLSDRIQAYAMGNFYESKANGTISPLTFAGQTAAGGTQFTLSPVFLPAYVCPRGTTVACTAANGTLNPNNPFAAQGQRARINYRYDQPRRTLTDAKTYRFSGGVSGSFGEGWGFNVDGTYSQVDLKVRNINYLIPQRLLDVINDGSFNFVDPAANDQAIRDYIAPPASNKSNSKLWQIQGSLQKVLTTLPGGDLSVLVGGSYRHESVFNPSANPVNEVNPADRYYSINSVSTVGSRNVKSAFFEVDAPIVEQLSLSASGRYDRYSSGQKNFSPKITAIVRPIPQVKLRGTFSRGFRIPSFQEAYGQPTTGYITSTLNSDNPGVTAYQNAHGNNAYATQPYTYGLTSSGNANLDPEKSTSYTGGVVFQPTSRISFTADYFHIKIKGLIGAPDYSGVEDAYYANNGVVDIPGITVRPGVADPDHPNALPALGFVEYSFVNTTSETVEGLDLSGRIQLPLTDSIRFNSRVDATYLIRLEQITPGGAKQRFDGTLSPCNVTSCSGAPAWRGSWQNTVEFADRGSISATAYYTSGYSMASVDYGGDPKADCEDNLGISVYATYNGNPYKCRAKRFIDVDLTATLKVNDRFTLYGNMLNVFDVKPDFNPGQTYDTGYSYNVAWESQGFIGRFFRVGARVDF